MSVLSDQSIISKCTNTSSSMITPFIEHSINHHPTLGKIPSYGLSSSGYDVRLQPTFKLFSKSNVGQVIDVLDYKEETFIEEITGQEVIIPPGGLLLGVTVETFNIPKDIVGVCLGKSTWARAGASVLVTPLESGWKGNLVVEINNGTNYPLKIYAGVGIAQIVFHELDRIPSTTYSDRNGKYNNQVGVAGSRL